MENFDLEVNIVRNPKFNWRKPVELKNVSRIMNIISSIMLVLLLAVSYIAWKD